MTLFAKEVYRVTKKIPKGKVSTYSDVAWAIGAPRSARAVGNALHKNPHAPAVPCHRIILSDGRVGGYGSGVTKKIKILRREGVFIERGKIDLKIYGWRFT